MPTLAYHACMLSLFQCVCVCKCECRSVSVEVSVFKGFSGRTLRNAFGKNSTSAPGRCFFVQEVIKTVFYSDVWLKHH